MSVEKYVIVSEWLVWREGEPHVQTNHRILMWWHTFRKGFTLRPPRLHRVYTAQIMRIKQL